MLAVKVTMRRGLLLVVCLLWLFIGCHAVKPCPPKEDISPCTCDPNSINRPIKCRNVTNPDTLYGVFDKSGDYPFEELEILSSTLMFLPATAVKKKKIQQISIDKCVMTSLFESRPDQADCLELLWIKDTRFLRGIDWTFFSSFSKLYVLDLNNVEVKKIGKMFKDNINSAMEYVTVVNGKTAVLEDDVFSSLLKLKEIEVSNSMIKTLKRSMFPAKSVLFYFNFRGNLIKSLPEDIFSNMPLLKTVFLDNNRLTTLPANIYADVYKIPKIQLTFDNNPVICDCSIVWIYPIQGNRVVNGTCAGPPSKKGKRFTSLSRRDFPQCGQPHHFADD